MILEKERTEIVVYCKKMLAQGLTTGTGGNISCFNRAKSLYAISPSSRDYTTLTPEDIVVLDTQNNIIDGSLRPSSEFSMHSIFYRQREDIDAVVHSHSPNATALACLRMDLPPFYYLNMIAGRDVKCTPYTRFGTEKLADLALEYMENRFAVILGNHGLLTGGDSLARAFKIAEIIEEAAKIYLTCRQIGEPELLSDTEINEMMMVFHKRTYI